MKLSTLKTLFASALLAPFAMAQGGDFLFTTSQSENTLSGSGGTVLRNLKPNEIHVTSFTSMPCTSLSAEKWSPRTCFGTMAGDEDGDTTYWEPGLFGNIDALLATFSTAAGGPISQRTIWYSPAVAMGTSVSGAPGLRPGDVGRIVRTGASDGQVQYFLRAEELQTALGMPPAPVVVNIDAIAFSPNYGIFFSLEVDQAVNTLCGVTFVRDGDVMLIPPAAISWNPNQTVAGVLPGRALRVYTELQMDGFVNTAQVTDRNGVCQTAILDTDDIEIDWNGLVAPALPNCLGPALPIPHLMFAGENLTGCSILTTRGGGSIYVGPCGPLGTSCGFGPTLGLQMGLRPPTAAQGVPSSITGLCTTRVNRFVTEARNHAIPWGTPVQLDIASPAPMTWVFMAFAPWGAGAVAPSTTFFPLGGFFPDYYAPPNFMGLVPTGTGFGTYTSPNVPWPVKLVWMGVTFNTAGNIIISTPTTTDVF
jgi:hypothetical protein